MKTILLFLTFGTLFSITTEDLINKTSPKSIIVLELFTSQGCSSCPPADALINNVINEIEKYGKEIFALSFHVDYWNHLGWKDPFSSEQFSMRQHDYAEHFGRGSYTPQLVVNGQKEFVGSNRSKLMEILSEKSLPDYEIILSKKLINNSQKNLQTIEVNYHISDFVKNATINICLVQNEATTIVQRGENSGRKLVHKNIVRVLKTQKLVQASGQTTLEIPKGLAVKDCSIIAFVQASDYKITGANIIKIIL